MTALKVTICSRGTYRSLAGLAAIVIWTCAVAAGCSVRIEDSREMPGLQRRVQVLEQQVSALAVWAKAKDAQQAARDRQVKK